MAQNHIDKGYVGFFWSMEMGDNEMSSKVSVFFGMLMFLVGLMIFVPAFSLQAADERQAQCESWAKEDGLEGKEAKEYIDYCMAEVNGSLAPAEEAAATK